MIAQVDEQQAAVVAHAVHPADRRNGRAHVPAAQRPQVVGACDAVHPGHPALAPVRPASFFTVNHDPPPVEIPLQVEARKAHGSIEVRLRPLARRHRHTQG